MIVLWRCFFLCVLAFWFDFSSKVQAEEFRNLMPKYLEEYNPGRHALVIGNANYNNIGVIPSAKADAVDVARSLNLLGFNVKYVTDVESERFFEDEILPAFRREIKQGDLVIFYYSGHGFSYGPNNYLSPVNMTLPVNLSEVELNDVAVSVEGVEDYLTRWQPGVLLMLIDACRTIGGFVDKNKARIVTKGMTMPTKYHKNINTIIGYATRPGEVAEGSDSSVDLSQFTKSLSNHLMEKDREFSELFNDISVDVRIETEDSQHPGLFDWSDSVVYLNPTDTILAQQKEAWLAALDSWDRKIIQRFSYRFAVSRYSAAARQWLMDNPITTSAPAFTQVSPVAVERAWRPTTSSRLAILPNTFGLAFERKVDLKVNDQVKKLEDYELGLVPSGTRMFDSAMQGSSLEAHGTAITTKDYIARSAPSWSASQVANLSFGTPVKISGVEMRQSDVAWVGVITNGDDKISYIPVQQSSLEVAPIELGRALLEIMVPKLHNGISDLVESHPIEDALISLKAKGRTITWVSISTALSEDDEEADARVARLAHVRYLLKRSGIDGRRITSVTNSEDVRNDGVRLRLFGY